LYILLVKISITISSLIFSLLFALQLAAQNSTVEELQKELAETEVVADKVDLLNRLAFELRSRDTDKAIIYASEAYDISKNNNYNYGLVNALSNWGLVLQYKGEYDKSLEKFYEGLKILDENADLLLEAKLLNNIGNLYWRTDDRVKAYDYYKQSYAIRKQANDSLGMAKVLGNLGNSANAVLHNKDSARYYYNTALDLFQALNDSNGLSITYSNLGNIENKPGSRAKALELYHQSLKIDKALNSLYGTTFAYSNLGNIHANLNNIDSAIYYYEKLLSTAEALNSLPRKRQAYQRLYGLYEEMGNYKMAFEYMKLFNVIDDSLMNRNIKDRMADLQLSFDNDIKQKEIDLLRTKTEKSRSEIDKKYWQNLFLFLILITVVLIAVAIWLRYRTKIRLYDKLEKKSNELEEAKQMIEESNQELISINESLEDKVISRTKELNESYQNLLISNQRLDHFTYRSAHDLKGPIASILGLTNLLKDEITKSDNPQAIQYVELVNKTSLKMENLLKRIIQSSQLNQTIVKKTEFLVEDLLKQVAEIIKLNDVENKIGISYELDSEHKIYTDASVLQIILRYLVNNSIQYLDPRKEQHEIIFKTASSPNGFYQIHVLDNGVGVDPQLVPDLFNMFSKGSSEAQNPGLGLYDANLLAEKIGGEVYFDDTDEEYTHFVVSFLSKKD